jgi:hypothetical protein
MDNSQYNPDYEINGKSLLLLNSLLAFYKNNISVLNYFISQKNTLSLRILDWLVTNYSKKQNVVYTLYKNNEKINFNIYLEYKSQLKAYSKKLFDPFCRRERIIINLTDLSWNIYDENDNDKKNEHNNLITTVGQLNFFKWFIENKVLTYAIDNIQKIDNDMITTLTSNKKKNKRTELSACASKNVCSLYEETYIKFS